MAVAKTQREIETVMNNIFPESPDAKYIAEALFDNDIVLGYDNGYEPENLEHTRVIDDFIKYCKEAFGNDKIAGYRYVDDEGPKRLVIEDNITYELERLKREFLDHRRS